MHKYIIRRLLYAIPTLFGITMLIFMAMRVLPGDVTAIMFGREGARRISDADREALEKSLGLKDPLYQQYGEWMWNIAQGRLGESFWRGDPIMDTIKRRGPLTLQIAIMGTIVSWVVGIPVGVFSALRRNSILDYVGRFFTVLFLAIPSFWLGSMLVLALLLQFEWKSPPGIIQPWDDPWRNLQVTYGPALVIGLSVSAFVARMTRSSLLEVIHEDYIRTARAKGLREQVVVFRHALRNALLPVVTLSGVIFGFLIGGSVAVEVAFGVPGLGKTLSEAFNDQDYAVIQNLALIYGVIFTMVNLMLDLTYAWLDPRIRVA